MGSSPSITYTEKDQASSDWSFVQKFSLRLAVVFFFLLIIPVEKSWYEKLFESSSLYDVLFAIAGYRVDLIDVTTESGRWGFASYVSWGFAFIVGVLGATIWSILARNSKGKDYNKIYYWLRVIVRYRIAIGLIAFGFIKFFPMQMPFPSVSNLHTDIGDYAAFKLYWQIVGVSYPYQIFIGFLEIAAGALMFFRPTIVLGAVINTGVFFNIAHANLGFDGAVHVYSSYFVLLSLFLLIQYLSNIWAVFVDAKVVKPSYYYPTFKTKNQRILHLSAKAIFIFLFLFVHGIYRYNRFYNEGILKEPVVAGLKGAAGHYQVTSFVVNGDTLKYSPADSVRWHDVAIERYSTLVYKTNKAIKIDLGNGGPSKSDFLKNYEYTGRAGGKTYLYYEIDSAEQVLYLANKNKKLSKKLSKSLDKENVLNLKKLYTTPLRDSINILKWSYARPTAGRLVLSGRDQSKDSITVVLDRLNETYYTGKEWFMVNNKYRYK
ncbi:hypothetical protein D3C87_361280 [compost metagenome]